MNLRESFRKAEAVLNPKPVCKGLFFRGYKNTFWSDGRYETKQGFRLLKRKSCKGWEECDSYDGEDSKTMRCDHWLLDDMRDMIDIDGVIMPEVEDGALYTLRMTNVETDWESGIVDGWDYEFYKVEENDTKK